MKAAFLLNFTRFIEWPSAPPANPDRPFAICILGNDPFGRVLDRMVEGESVNGRRLVVQRIEREQAHACQVVFAGAGERQSAGVIAAGAGVLTVGEGDGFLREGGVIAFVVENRRVRFDVSQSAAAKAGLKISSKLLSVARSVAR